MTTLEELRSRLDRLQCLAIVLRERVGQLPLAVRELLRWIDDAPIGDLVGEFAASGWGFFRGVAPSHQLGRTYAQHSWLFYKRSMQHARRLGDATKGAAVLYAASLGSDAARSEQETTSLCRSIAFNLLGASPTGYRGPDYYTRPELVGRPELIEEDARSTLRAQFAALHATASAQAESLQRAGSIEEPFAWMGIVRRWLDGRSPGDGVASSPGVNAPACVFVRIGRRWRLVFDGREALLGALDGFAYLHELVRRQGTEVSVADLERAAGKRTERGPLDLAEESAAKDSRMRSTARMETKADATGVGELRAAIQRLEQGMSDDAWLGNDEDLARGSVELDELRRELSRTVGRGGRLRPHKDPHDDRRMRVAQGVGRALRALDKEHPVAAAHFRSAIRRPMGGSPSYSPPARIEWVLV